MTNHKHHRSVFCHSISSLRSPPLRMAQLDFFGSVSLVCAIGLAAKLVQALLAN